MKATIIMAAAAMIPSLFAAEPTVSAPQVEDRPAPISQADLAEQAALVQKIGEEAAHGFDPVAHAQMLRMQMEALAGASSTPKTASAPAVALSPAPVPELSKSVPLAPVRPVESELRGQANAQNQAVRGAIQKLRALLDELEVQVTNH